ncbi:hypothetical protein C2845_PM02G11060 [Panicum miliaceum]|uniref:C2H2-type domain-containing protein n=1 Tax=Panicum miliaceum TaxID=4540 RepID=A0A3L6SHY2_PANMI|nr:hypothetical protein C2845_PM02G11060 [Panicum miliaceum]
MASPFPGTTAVIKVEDEENGGVSGGLVLSDQELRNKFWEDVKRRAELRKRGLCASGSAQPPPLPPPPVQPPPPPPPAHHPWAKRPATVPPPGLAGVRQPPPKQYQRRPPGQRASVQPQHPAPNACRALAPPAPPPAHAAGPGAMPPPLHRRSAPPKPPRHPAAKKKPTVPCAFCGVLCMTAWHLEQHEKWRKHRNKVAYLAGEMNVQCPVCDVRLSGALNVEQHFAGKQHIWRLKLKGGA